MDETTLTEKQEKIPSKLKILLGTIRGEKGMSAKKMAKALDFSPAYLAQVESETTAPSVKFIKNCIQTFELSQDRAFELFTAAYEQHHSFTLNLDEIAEQGILDREVLSKLLSLITICNAPFNPHNINYIGAKPYDQIIAFKKAILELWDVWFANFKDNC
ncbi:MAG: helix-turn-helix domain-containing protein [Prevotella sp.]|jgi:transcriptional regulator with XRE-family HTH domain|nr:helix-turn-helix domain-containing protein [Prevotella sp.]